MHGPSSSAPTGLRRARLGSPVPLRKARLEIIPLIDIMFFLLACFMLVSLSMVNLKSLKVNLATATAHVPETKPDYAAVTVDRSGNIFLDKKPVGRNELREEMIRRLAANREVRVLISGDRDARHGDMLGVLDAVRAAGIERVAFETRELSPAGRP